MLNFMSNHPTLTAWLATLIFLFVTIIVLLISMQVEKYFKVKYNYTREISKDIERLCNEIMEQNDEKNLDIDIASADDPNLN